MSQTLLCVLWLFFDIFSRFKMLLLLSCMIIAGIKAGELPTMHYQVKGGSLCLHVGKSPTYEYVRWYFNEKLIVVERNITPNYKDKVDYNPMNHSLCINKLTETDSGFYKVSFADLNFTESTEIHKIILQEAVPSPVIKMSAVGPNPFAGFCNVSVNCSVLCDWVLALCDEDSCRTVQRSFSTVNITISVDNTSVVCIGNNHVSTGNVSESMAATCYNKSIHDQEESSRPSILIVIVIAAVCVTLCAFIACLWKIHR
uniref:T-lymphocyte surface antigen Ly-9-like n=1 Tax=Semicossyphus pulcher TaxID=241346 RepID=UPI0037E879E6